ncbi:MAG TPA: glycoside hydrolase family 2 TIM barrel-domain containing protein [Polyangiaceae bacterium]|nr:glycoside hydrolase family 2 TIM barrel-domain containing protein [Polyangiaceae bacterium]
MTNRNTLFLITACACYGLLGAACSSDQHSSSGTSASGGANAGTGPSNAGSGGQVANGGATSSGGTDSGAGAAGSAGQTALGGAGGTGGSAGLGGASASGGVLVNTYDGARSSTVSFDLGWKFHLGDVSGAQATAFDDSSWSAIDVPHDWSISLPFNQNSPAGAGGGYLDGGTGWYRKSFSLPATSSNQRVMLQFDGVYMDSTVWLNGTQVCARPYGFSSFECDITSNAHFGDSNVVAVKVNNQQPSSRWYSGSGIYRHVWLKTVSPVRVAYTGTSVTTPQVSASSASVNVSITLQNDGSSTQDVTVASSIRDASGAEVANASSPATSVAAGKSASVTQATMITHPDLWSPSNPKLYSVITTVTVGGTVVDTYTTPFGVRSFAFDASNGFSLNGSPMKLNGICMHHDLGSLGAAVNYRAIERRLESLKLMGVNAIRTSHNPPAPELLDIADRLGFLVMDEAFDCWYNGKNKYDYGRFFKQWANTDISDMVSRDRNHPGIIIWSIANEVGETSDTATVTQLMDAIKTKDTTRPIGQALAAWAAADTPAVALEDVVGINYAPDRYDSIHTAHPSWKMFASESSSALRSRGIYNNNNTQCSSYDDFAAGWGATAEASWKNVNTRPWIAGEFIWTGIDYIGEPTPYEWPAKSSYFGAIDTAGFPKDIFYFYQSKWNASGPTMVHIVPMNWTNWTAGQSVKVMVYTNADSVELFLNGKSLGSQNMTASTGHLQWSVPFATGTLEAKASKAGAVVVSDKLQTAGAPAALSLKVDRASIAADGRDLAFVEADVVDAQGVLVPQPSNSIAFSLSGPGVIAGVDNGNAVSHESYQGTSRSAFSGKALAIVRASTTPGMITLTASSGSLTGSSVAITTAAP